MQSACQISAYAYYARTPVLQLKQRTDDFYATVCCRLRHYTKARLQWVSAKQTLRASEHLQSACHLSIRETEGRRPPLSVARAAIPSSCPATPPWAWACDAAALLPLPYLGHGHGPLWPGQGHLPPRLRLLFLSS